MDKSKRRAYIKQEAEKKYATLLKEQWKHTGGLELAALSDRTLDRLAKIVADCQGKLLGNAPLSGSGVLLKADSQNYLATLRRKLPKKYRGEKYLNALAY